MAPLSTAAAITNFINDDQTFKSSIEDWFTSLDVDHDGLISFMEMAYELMSLRMLRECFDVDCTGLSHPDLVELHRDIFSGLDRDGSRGVGLEEFGEEMKDMLMAVVDRIGMSKKKKKMQKEMSSLLYAKL